MTGATPETPAVRTSRARLAGAALLLAFAAALALDVGSRLPLQTGWFDAYQRLSPRKLKSMPATIVEIDDASLASLGRWPWPRTLLAQLVHTINAYNPGAIGIDIFMPESDPLSPERALTYANADSALVERMAALPSNDEELATALAAAPTVMIASGVDGAPSRPARMAPIRAQDAGGNAKSAADAIARLDRFPAALANLDVLGDAAHGWGLTNVPLLQGVVRRLPLVASVDGALAPAFALEMWRLASRAADMRLVTARGAARRIEIGDRRFAMDADGSVRMHFSHHDPGRFVSAVDVLSGRVGKDRLGRTFVLIGVTAHALGDFVYTPVGEQIPDVEVHAQLLESLNDGTFLVRPAWARWVEAAALLAVGASLLWMMPHWPVRYVALFAIACAGALLVLAFLLFRVGSLELDAATPVACFLVLFGVTLATALANARRAHLGAVYMFSRFVNPNVVRELLKDVSFASTGQSRELTILFSDIRNFTAMSEARSPDRIVSLLNEYFTRQVDIVFRHKGALDKFIGDGVMAFWGAPLDDVEHAKHAVECALDIVANLDSFRTDMGLRPEEFEIGIGLHTGRAIVGLIGSETRREYTAIGGAVNLASRMEELTKTAKRTVLVSRETMEQCANAFRFEYVGAFAVRGVAREVQAYEPRAATRAYPTARSPAPAPARPYPGAGSSPPSARG